VDFAAYLVDKRGGDFGEAVVALRVTCNLRENRFFAVCGENGLASGNDIATSKLFQGNPPN